jgi:hypothetical protein
LSGGQFWQRQQGPPRRQTLSAQEARRAAASCGMFRQMRSQFPYSAYRGKSAPAASGFTDFLRRGTLAALMPTVNRLVALQKDCATILPAMFNNCDILLYEAGQLVLATPNAAMAAKLKQQLPKLQAELEKRGWQISAIRLKVQVTKSLPPVVHMRALELPDRAVTAFDELSKTLPPSPQNEKLIAALRSMVRRRQE